MDPYRLPFSFAPQQAPEQGYPQIQQQTPQFDLGVNGDPRLAELSAALSMPVGGGQLQASGQYQPRGQGLDPAVAAMLRYSRSF